MGWRRNFDGAVHAWGSALRRHCPGPDPARIPGRPPRPPLHARVWQPRLLRYGVLELPRAGREGRLVGGMLARLDRFRRHGRAGHSESAVIRRRRQHGVVRTGRWCVGRLRGSEEDRDWCADAERPNCLGGGRLPGSSRLCPCLQALEPPQLAPRPRARRRHRRAPEPRGRGRGDDGLVRLPARGQGRSDGACHGVVPRG
mmetsp:Transcript_93413/g.302426  ORF Transcript_93413/g.302426 Transcript_93413/m.302426 type:complete len:200 (-) Transcript_93413:1734-2333(-)